MNFFPKIKFVDEMPEHIKYAAKQRLISGVIGAYDGLDIYVLKRIRFPEATLLHELGHWVIHKITKPNNYQHRIDTWFDKYFTTKHLGPNLRLGNKEDYTIRHTD